jgi:rSAM/selenodomain-associated transferase 1
MTTSTVALLLKAPREGHVKTRLGCAVGAVEATRIYRRLVEHQIAQLPLTWPAHVHFTPAECGEQMRSWLGRDYGYSAQADGDLGDRLIAALRTHFATSNSPVIFIGGDCPYLSTEHFERVARLLAETEAVLIPALDGGYCLLALRRPDEHLFTAINWGSDRVADETRQRLREQNFSWKELPALEDVDDEASWTRAREAIPDLAPI